MLLTRQMFVFGQNHHAQVQEHSKIRTERAKFEALSEPGETFTLRECWNYLEGLDGEVKYGGIVILPQDALDNHHLLSESLLSGKELVILDNDDGKFTVGRLLHNGQYYSATLGGQWSGWLLAKKPIVDDPNAIPTSAAESLEIAWKNGQRGGNFFDGRSYRSLRVGDVDREAMHHRHRELVEYARELAGHHPWIKEVLSTPSLTSTERYRHLFIMGIPFSFNQLINWSHTLSSELNLSLVPDAYIRDGDWACPITLEVNSAQWTKHCLSLWDELKDTTSVTVYSIT